MVQPHLEREAQPAIQKGGKQHLVIISQTTNSAQKPLSKQDPRPGSSPGPRLSPSSSQSPGSSLSFGPGLNLAPGGILAWCPVHSFWAFFLTKLQQFCNSTRQSQNLSRVSEHTRASSPVHYSWNIIVSQIYTPRDNALIILR